MPFLTMDPIKIEKLEAINKYKQNQFLNNLILYSRSLTVLTCILFCSSPFWFPSLCFSVKVFLFFYLPNIWSFFINPNCLFIVGNIIIVFLVRDSKLLGSYSSPDTDIYNEYVKESRSLRQFSAPKEKIGMERKWEIPLIEETVKRVEKDGEDKEEEGKEEKIEEEEEEKKEREDDSDKEEEFSLPAEELNKRVEDFIARINKQRRLEANY